MILLLFFLVFFLIIVLAKLINNKNIIIIIFASILILQIVIFPEICIKGAIDGALLFFNKVFPSLFPFMVISNIILAFDGIALYSKIFGKLLCRPLRLPLECSFVIIISFLCGYPLGAKYTCELHEKGIIDNKTCERLLNIATNASPLFIVGSVGTLMLHSTFLGYYLLLANALSCIIMGIILPSKNKTSSSTKELAKINTNIGFVLKNSIDLSIKTCISVGGFVTIFSVLNTILSNSILFKNITVFIAWLFKITPDIITAILLGIVEMTNGCYLISQTNSNEITKLAIASFMITFSGFSIISQVYTFSYKYKVSIKKYICRKAVQGLFSSIIIVFLYKITINNNLVSAFNYSANTTNTLYIYYLIIIIFLLPIIALGLKNLFKIP